GAQPGHHSAPGAQPGQHSGPGVQPGQPGHHSGPQPGYHSGPGAQPGQHGNPGAPLGQHGPGGQHGHGQYGPPGQHSGPSGPGGLSIAGPPSGPSLAQPHPGQGRPGHSMPFGAPYGPQQPYPGHPGPYGPYPPRQRRGNAGRTVAIVAAVLVPLLVLGVALTRPWNWGSLEVGADTGVARLTVPRAWAAQLATSNWDPSALGVVADPQRALLVAASVKDYPDTADTRPGAFVGLLPAGTEPDAGTFRILVGRAGCTEVKGAPSHPDAEASLRQRCGDVVLDDILIDRDGSRAWVQIKQPYSSAEDASNVLASVRLTGRG
ncbi:MAG TPA: hypothetical protein VGD67_14280, partial [Pseudonocardiaceae bacterium]